MGNTHRLFLKFKFVTASVTKSIYQTKSHLNYKKNIHAWDIGLKLCITNEPQMIVPLNLLWTGVCP